ncbi:MAG: chloride channel protein [Clostridia bacterium]|nr:chloride channel protein [Clostridia bacterium]
MSKEKILVFKKTLANIVPFLKWLFLAAIVGVVGGAVGSIFHRLLDLVTEIRAENLWIIALLPVGGVLIALLYELFKKKGGLNTDRIIDAVLKDEEVPLVLSPLIFVSTAISHLFGASVGREGAALQLGGSIGYNIGKCFKLSKRDLHIVVMIGMSSVFSALFGTPLTAAVFAIELTTVGEVRYGGFLPCVIASVIAYQIALMFGISPIDFSFVALMPISVGIIIKVIGLSFLCALVSIAFSVGIRKGEIYLNKLLPNVYLKAVVGALVIVLLTFLLKTYDYNGAGMDVITNAMKGNFRPEAFLIKMIFTVMCIAAGFKGGEIVPTLFIGATFGALAGTFLGLDAGFSAAIGFVALFCGMVNCPIASLFLAIEVFGTGNMMIFAIAVGVSYLMSGHFSLYKSQKFLYSKLTDEYVNTK